MGIPGRPRTIKISKIGRLLRFEWQGLQPPCD